MPLDLALPDGNGLDLLHALKTENAAAGLLCLTARDSLEDRVAGLDLGADDYLVKPFHLSELNARLRAIIRRRQLQRQHHLVFRDLLVWPERAEVLARGQPLALTQLPQARCRRRADEPGPAHRATARRLLRLCRHALRRGGGAAGRRPTPRVAFRPAAG